MMIIMKGLKVDLLKILCDNDDEPQRQAKLQPKTPLLNRSSNKSITPQHNAKPAPIVNKPKVIQNIPLKPIEFSRKSREEEEPDIHKDCIDADEFTKFTEKYRKRLEENKMLLDNIKDLKDNFDKEVK